MNILADESVDRPVIERLRLDGHAVEAIEEVAPGLLDDAVLARAVAQRQLLLTADRDFGDMIMRDLQKAPAEGVVLYRLRTLPIASKVQTVADAFAQHAAQLPGAFTVVEQRRIRHRTLP